MKLSIIIPTYNGAAILERSLHTWTQQTLSVADFEVIVVDNNSTDETESVVKKQSLLQSNIKYIKETRIGATHARHAGARVAKADILIFADNDGLFNSRCLEAILEVYSAKENVEAVACKIEIEWDKNEPNWIAPYRFMLGELHYSDEVSFSYDYYFNGGLFSIKKSAFEELNGFNPDLVGGYLIGDGDTGLVHKVHKAHKLIGFTPFAIMKHLQFVDIHGSKAGVARHFFNVGISTSYALYRENNFIQNGAVLKYRLLHFALFLKKYLQYNVLRKRDISTFFSLQQRRGELKFFRYLRNNKLRDEICKKDVYNI